jgi:hypothetical protein
MSEPPNKYTITLRDLRGGCPLLASITVTEPEGLAGRSLAGELVIQCKGRITPALVKKFRDAYQRAVHEGIIKPRSKGEQLG